MKPTPVETLTLLSVRPKTEVLGYPFRSCLFEVQSPQKERLESRMEDAGMVEARGGRWVRAEDHRSAGLGNVKMMFAYEFHADVHHHDQALCHPGKTSDVPTVPSTNENTRTPSQPTVYQCKLLRVP